MINALKKKRIQIKQKSVKWLNDNILLENPFLWRRPIENQIIIHFDLIVMNLICALVYFLMAVFEIITYLDIYLIIFLGMIPVLFRLLSEIKPFYSEEAKVPIVGSIDLREEWAQLRFVPAI